MTKCVQIVQLEIPQIPHNSFGPSAQSGQFFWDIFEKISHHMSIVYAFYNNISVNLETEFNFEQFEFWNLEVQTVD